MTTNDDIHSYNPSKFPLPFQFPLSTTTPNTDDLPRNHNEGNNEPAQGNAACHSLTNLPPHHGTDPTTAMMTETAPTLKTHPGPTTTLPHQHPPIRTLSPDQARHLHLRLQRLIGALEGHSVPSTSRTWTSEFSPGSDGEPLSLPEKTTAALTPTTACHTYWFQIQTSSKGMTTATINAANP